MTDLGDTTANHRPAATLMVYKYLLQRHEAVWGVAGWLWALLWCYIADPFKLSVCLSFPATRTQELAGEGVRKGNVGLVMDSWNEKATGSHQSESDWPTQAQEDMSHCVTGTLQQLFYIYIILERAHVFILTFTDYPNSPPCELHQSSATMGVFVFPRKHLYPLCVEFAWDQSFSPLSQFFTSPPSLPDAHPPTLAIENHFSFVFLLFHSALRALMLIVLDVRPEKCKAFGINIQACAPLHIHVNPRERVKGRTERT